MMQAIVERARRWSCRGIDLCVDEGNHPARALYSKHNFIWRETVADYYAQGRNGMKMSLTLQI
jgi:ribosomal protein S18 acetylase RimI-like enzyme